MILLTCSRSRVNPRLTSNISPPPSFTHDAEASATDMRRTLLRRVDTAPAAAAVAQPSSCMASFRGVPSPGPVHEHNAGVINNLLAAVRTYD